MSPVGHCVTAKYSVYFTTVLVTGMICYTESFFIGFGFFELQ